MAGTALQLVVGLGNPGPEHQLTRHNAGFWFVDMLAQKCGQRFRSHAKFHGEICRIEFARTELHLLKPGTFMNRSGLAVRAMADFYKVRPEQILVVHDELDLPPCVLRYKFGGGPGGNNGVRDVIAHMGAEFWRLRVGIGHPGDKSQVIDYLLRPAPAVETEKLFDNLHASLDSLRLFIEEGAEKAMNALHTEKSK